MYIYKKNAQAQIHIYFEPKPSALNTRTVHLQQNINPSNRK